jgi:hypothetical protein
MGSRINWVKTYFLASLFLFFFLSGAAVVILKIFPYKFLLNGAIAIADLKSNWIAYTIRPQAPFIRKNEFGGSGLLFYDEDRAYPGVTLYSGLEGKKLAVHLIDMKGNHLHKWTVSFNELWPKAEHLDSQPGDLHQSILGSMLLENGDVVMNIDRAGMVRLDRCGNIVWKVPVKSHHQFNSSPNGGFWVPCEESGEKLYPGKVESSGTPSLKLTKPEAICEISPDGRLVRMIDPVAAFFRSGLGSVLMPSGLTEYKSYHFSSDGNTFTHLNDVEVLTSEYAHLFPMFKAGDLLLSLATQNLLAVVDPDTEIIKWTHKGSYFNQHDPDFLPNGRISVFDNLGANLDINEEDGSRILEINPATGESRTLYSSSSKNYFFSETQGNSQFLGNGNRMIVESVRGRIFEIDENGDIVWSFVTKWGESDDIVITYEASRYPVHYAAFLEKNCP